MNGALKGIKVVELAQIMAGPTCGMLLADMGADVIKVEKLPGGDDTRSYTEPSIHGESAAFMILNRNKRGIAVNLKKPGGLEVVKRLLAGADVVTENYRKGTLEKLGLGYDVLEKLNPRLIYCAVSGYGRTGPYADKGGFDLIAQGFAGIMTITGEPGGPPPKTATSYAATNPPTPTPLPAPLMTPPHREWDAQVEAAGGPGGRAKKRGDMLAAPQVAAREMVIEVDPPTAGRVKTLGTPIKFSGTPGSVTRAAPLLG